LRVLAVERRLVQTHPLPQIAPDLVKW